MDWVKFVHLRNTVKIDQTIGSSNFDGIPLESALILPIIIWIVSYENEIIGKAEKIILLPINSNFLLVIVYFEILRQMFQI